MEKRQNDSVDKYFKEGLSGLNATPDDALWAGIESGLDQPKTASASVWRWLVVLIPAIGCASMLWFASTAANRAMAMEMAYNEKAELLDSLVKVIDLNVQNQRTSNALSNNFNDPFENLTSEKVSNTEVVVLTSQEKVKTDDSPPHFIDSVDEKGNYEESSRPSDEVEQNVDVNLIASNSIKEQESVNEEDLIHQNGAKSSNQASGMMRQHSTNRLIVGALSLINRRPFSVKENFYQSSLLGEVQNIDFPCEGGYATPWFVEFSPNWNFSQRIFGKGDEGATDWQAADEPDGIATFAESQNSAEPNIKAAIKMSETLQSSLGFSMAAGRKIGSRFEVTLGLDFYQWKMKQSNGGDVYFQAGATDLSPDEVYISDGSSLFGSLGTQEINIVNDYQAEELSTESENIEPFSYELQSELRFVSIPLKVRFNVNDVISFNAGIAYSRLLTHTQNLTFFEPQEVFESRLKIQNQKSFLAAQLGVRVNAVRGEKYSLYFEFGDEFHLNPIYSDYYYRTFLTRSYIGMGVRYDLSKKCK